MFRLRLQSRAAILFETMSNQGVDDIVPGLQHGLAVVDGRFLLLRFTQLERAAQTAAGEDRQRDTGANHVLQRTRLEEILDVQRIKTDGTVELDLRIEIADGDADGRGRGMKLVL